MNVLGMGVDKCRNDISTGMFSSKNDNHLRNARERFVLTTHSVIPAATPVSRLFRDAYRQYACSHAAPESDAE